MQTQKKPFMVVATEPTPNAAAFKFNLNQKAIEGATKAYNSEEEAEGDPFAEKLFSFGVVEAVLIHDRFVSVTLDAPEEWEMFLDPIIQCIQEDLVYYGGEASSEKKESILDQVKLEEFDTFSDAVKAEVLDAFMDENIRPALAGDGGGVLVDHVEDNDVFIRYQGACGSCFKSQSTTLSAIQSILQSKVSPNLRVLTVSTGSQGGGHNIGQY